MKALPQDLAELFEFDLATLRVASREGKHREFKRQLAAGDMLRYGKTLAAFSNTDGGVIVFGVIEKASAGLKAMLRKAGERTVSGSGPSPASWSTCSRRRNAPTVSAPAAMIQTDRNSL